MPSTASKVKDPEMMAVPLADRFALSPEQTSAITGIGITRIREAIRNGTLIAHTNGANIVLLPDDIKAWLTRLPAFDIKNDRPD
jgi:hypothetical protein